MAGRPLGTAEIPRRTVACWSLFTLQTGLVSAVAVLVVVRFLFGAAESGTYHTAARAIYGWLPARDRGLALGLLNTGSRDRGGRGGRAHRDVRQHRRVWTARRIRGLGNARVRTSRSADRRENRTAVARMKSGENRIPARHGPRTRGNILSNLLLSLIRSFVAPLTMAQATQLRRQSAVETQSAELNISPAASKPPSTLRMCPVTKLASSEARNRAAAAISLGCA